MKLSDILRGQRWSYDGTVLGSIGYEANGEEIADDLIELGWDTEIGDHPAYGQPRDDDLNPVPVWYIQDDDIWFADGLTQELVFRAIE